jgi:hypothetical protein
LNYNDFEKRNETISEKCCYGANNVPNSVRAARGRRQFQFPQTLLGGIGVQGDKRPCIPLPDEKGNRSAEADPALFMGKGEYAYERDKEPPSPCEWWCKT